MDEWHYEQAQRREENERTAGIEAIRHKAARRVNPVVIYEVAHCPDCLTPLEPHRVEPGICVPCLEQREQIERRERR